MVSLTCFPSRRWRWHNLNLVFSGECKGQFSVKEILDSPLPSASSMCTPCNLAIHANVNEQCEHHLIICTISNFHWNTAQSVLRNLMIVAEFSTLVSALIRNLASCAALFRAVEALFLVACCTASELYRLFWWCVAQLNYDKAVPPVHLYAPTKDHLFGRQLT